MIADLRKDASLSEIHQYVRSPGRTRLDAWITRWTFRGMLLKRAYTLDQFRALAARSRVGSGERTVGPIEFKARLVKTPGAP